VKLLNLGPYLGCAVASNPEDELLEFGSDDEDIAAVVPQPPVAHPEREKKVKVVVKPPPATQQQPKVTPPQQAKRRDPSDQAAPLAKPGSRSTISPISPGLGYSHGYQISSKRSLSDDEEDNTPLKKKSLPAHTIALQGLEKDVKSLTTGLQARIARLDAECKVKEKELSVLRAQVDEKSKTIQSLGTTIDLRLSNTETATRRIERNLEGVLRSIESINRQLSTRTTPVGAPPPLPVLVNPAQQYQPYQQY